MKILVTGASGFIGQILAESLAEHDLVLWSRSEVPTRPGAEYFTSEDLRNVTWWQRAEIPQDVDVVIHLAEPVKTQLSEAEVESIRSSHSAFLSHACTSARLVIYPTTAYRYDHRVGKKNLQYLKIKLEVARELSNRENFISPVIHPLVDTGGALARLIDTQGRVPFFNLFCSFPATLPVLTVPDLVTFFREQIASEQLLHTDWYAGQSSIADLTSAPNRRNWALMSNTFKLFLTPLSNVPTFSLLLSGRDIR